MGGVNVDGGGHGGKKSVDSEIPLIPFIDLLLCCIMFLLVTAVWNKLARLNVAQQSQTNNPQVDQQEERIRVFLRIQEGGRMQLEASDGTETPIEPVGSETYNLTNLREVLQSRHRSDPNNNSLIVVPDDGVDYSDVIAAMDVAIGAEFTSISTADAVF